jgi:hypothetical protein
VIHIGLSREETVQVEQVIAQLDAAPHNSAADRRVRPRIDFCHPMWINLPTEPGQPWIHVFSRNLSTGGLAFLARREFAMEEYMVISHHLNEGVPQLALCCVKFSRAVTDGIFEVGLEFQAIAPDVDNLRHIPSRWTALILRNTWISRTRQNTLAES